MKLSTTFKVAALALLLPATAIAAGPAGKPANAGAPQIGAPVTPHSINADLRNLPVAPQWKPGQAIREAHKRQFHAPDAIRPHAPASKPTASDRLPELQQTLRDLRAAREQACGLAVECRCEEHPCVRCDRFSARRHSTARLWGTSSSWYAGSQMNRS